MKTQILPANDSASIDTALHILQEGGLVAFPTDTVYGVGALVFDEQAVRTIYVAKDRPDEKAIPVLLGDPADLDRVAVLISSIARRFADRFWPGPLTLVVHKQPGLPAAVSATDTVGVRIPDHAAARNLLRVCGPMAVSSANVSGQQSASTAKEVSEQLGGRIALILDGGRTPGGVPSTVVDCTKPEPLILRAGPLTLEELQTALQ